MQPRYRWKWPELVTSSDANGHDYKRKTRSRWLKAFSAFLCSKERENDMYDTDYDQRN